MKTFKNVVIFLAAISILQSCGLYDLRSSEIKKEGVTVANEQKGKLLLEKAWRKQGFDQLDSFKTYSFHGKDTWRGLLGNLGKVWADSKLELDFKYRIRTFDGQVTFLEGKEKGVTAGLQDWHFYRIENGNPTFSDKDLKKNERKVFGIAAYQYFSEMADRLRLAPIISYAGEDEFRGQKYDLVFCTWGSPEPHLEHDQYVAWINQKTGLLDFTQYTIRESYLKPPGYKSIGGAIEFADFKPIEGIMIPHSQIVYAIKMRKNPDNNLHKLQISNFKFDAFEETALQVDKNIALGTASKN